MQALNFAANVYIALTLAPSIQPSTLPSAAGLSDSLSHVGQVGQLHDVQLFSVPKAQWSDEISSRLQGTDGVMHVDIQSEPRQRAKRDEF
ncbi:hypothetical protein BD626DRAFT_211853 [Schizophyllum amplum]|uniref:Uncharacterized protein n=1 Tax=Schizophyllum amplum TaxID=97359 RepID=A0A550BY57_9AGAR|nr:hypothetical protein BD626DRAFT_211853 [Auriculariopsis ampla]